MDHRDTTPQPGTDPGPAVICTTPLSVHILIDSTLNIWTCDVLSSLTVKGNMLLGTFSHQNKLKANVGQAEAWLNRTDPKQRRHISAVTFSLSANRKQSLAETVWHR